MKYLLKFKPLDKFFFGRDKTFGDDSYFAISHYLPQQTQVLGMLRKELMIQHGFLTRKRQGEWVDKSRLDKARALVGSKRFDILSKETIYLGKIKTISPIFLINQDELLHYFSAKDRGLYFEKKQNALVILRFENNELYKAKDAKVLTSQKILSKNSQYSIEDIFIKDEQVGIKKHRDGKSEDDAFFKKISYKLEKKFSFGVVVDIDTTIRDSIVSLGGENSLFKMEAILDHPLCNNHEQELASLYKKEKVDKLILITDSLIETNSETIFNNCAFSITDSVAVRTIDTKVSKVKVNKNNQEKYKDYRFEKSATFNFFKQGSIFYNPSDKLIELIKNENLQNVGYNKYEIIKGEQK